MNKLADLLKHMQEDIWDIETFIEDMSLELFDTDNKTKKAVCMSLINIGELAKNLPKEFKEKHKEIPWKLVTGMRDVTAHRYHSMSVEDIWKTVKEDIQPLKKAIEEELRGNK